MTNPIQKELTRRLAYQKHRETPVKKKLSVEVYASLLPIRFEGRRKMLNGNEFRQLTSFTRDSITEEINNFDEDTF